MPYTTSSDLYEKVRKYKSVLDDYQPKPRVCTISTEVAEELHNHIEDFKKYVARDQAHELAYYILNMMDKISTTRIKRNDYPHWPGKSYVTETEVVVMSKAEFAEEVETLKVEILKRLLEKMEKGMREEFQTNYKGVIKAAKKLVREL